MIVNEIAREYKIPVTKNFGTSRKYYLANVYYYKADAQKRVKDLRSMGYLARSVEVIKPQVKPKTTHTAVYWSPK